STPPCPWAGADELASVVGGTTTPHIVATGRTPPCHDSWRAREPAHSGAYTVAPVLDCSGANPWQTRASRVAFDNGRLRVREDEVVQPDGKPGAYTYVELPDPVVAIVPVTDDGRVHLVRQWRYPWRQNSWEIPAGRCEPNEPPLRAAQREL